MKKRRHILITGTGRSGTTFLVELLTNLGLETGFNENSLKSSKYRIARAGLETDLRLENCPYIVKDPSFGEYADEIIEDKNIILDHVIIPIRDLNAASESRRFVSRNTLSEMSFLRKLIHRIKKRTENGGLIRTQSFLHRSQEKILLNQFYNLLLSLSSLNIPITFIKHPRSVKDDLYLFNKLEPILGDIEFKQFSLTHKKTIQPKLIHSFNDNDT